ncbi:MAG: flagellar biosynthetic protein FliQ [Candidatus Cloacimonadota bacterium]|nr:flagellar biosynthetic protein FliQ [Candidatus Cloacimonadota bacterium]
MSQQLALNLLQETIKIGMTVTAPILLTSLVVGLIISIFQVVTSVQEFTLTFIPKILATALVVILILPWATSSFVSFTRMLFRYIIQVAR